MHRMVTSEYRLISKKGIETVTLTSVEREGTSDVGEQTGRRSGRQADGQADRQVSIVTYLEREMKRNMNIDFGDGKKESRDTYWQTDVH